MNTLFRRMSRPCLRLAVIALGPVAFASAQQNPKNSSSAQAELSVELRQQAQLIDKLSRDIAEEKRASGIVTSEDAALMHQYAVLRESRSKQSSARSNNEKLDREVKEWKRIEASGVSAIPRSSWGSDQNALPYVRMGEIRRRVEELFAASPSVAARARNPEDDQRELDRLNAEAQRLAAETLREKSPEWESAQRDLVDAGAQFGRAQTDVDALEGAVAELRELEREVRIQSWVFDSLRRFARDEANPNLARGSEEGTVRVFVLGEVRQPGMVNLRSSDRLFVKQAIAGAGGLAVSGKRTVTRVIRRSADGTHAQLEHPTPRESDTDLFGVLAELDIVCVTETSAVVRPGKVFVAGHVNQQQLVSLFNDRPTRIVYAIEKAGGGTRLARWSPVVLERADPATGRSTQRVLDLRPFFAGTRLGDADVMLAACRT
jgi:protein involved in polysaccharide export with SLBB domain